jgi:hypothetical protein
MAIQLRNPLCRLIALAVTAVKKAAKENPGAIPAGVQNLTACIAAAGTNAGQLQTCAAKFKK